MTSQDRQRKNLPLRSGAWLAHSGAVELFVLMLFRLLDVFGCAGLALHMDLSPLANGAGPSKALYG